MISDHALPAACRAAEARAWAKRITSRFSACLLNGYTALNRHGTSSLLIGGFLESCSALKRNVEDVPKANASRPFGRRCFGSRGKFQPRMSSVGRKQKSRPALPVSAPPLEAGVEVAALTSATGQQPTSQSFMKRSAISIELRMVSASSDNVPDETLRLFSDPRDDP
jgi:hypothetical protein